MRVKPVGDEVILHGRMLPSFVVSRSVATVTLMSLAEALATVSFRYLQPLQAIPRWISPFLTHSFSLPQCIFDRWNTVIPFLDSSRLRALKRAATMRKMSTLAVGAIICECVRRMPSDSCYLNIGTWRGFSLFAGMAGNPEKHCIGVDSFVQFGGPRRTFLRRFQKLRSTSHHFFDVDWRQYMQLQHTAKIGVLFYDAAHDEKSQLDALIMSDPLIIMGGIIIVDDTNWDEPRNAVQRFLEQNKGYRILFDQRTSGNCHPTFWNGLIVLEKCSSK